jgi:hypothetical protein
LNEYISISSVTAAYGSALTAGHFWRDPKVTKRSSPHHSVPRLGSACPHSGLNPWAAVMGHPWPRAANPASCRVPHGFKPAFGQRGFTGRSRSRSKSKARSRADRYFPDVSRSKCGRGLAPDGGPPNPCRITGIPSVSEVPSVGARAFCLLLRFSKVSRCKSGTISGRDRSNGYVLGPSKASASESTQ